MAELALFLKQVASKPREVGGAVAPSSLALAKSMVDAVPDGPGNIVELGAGTGKIKTALLDAGTPVTAIHSFEINPVFFDHLQREHPQLHVYRDRAENFSQHGIGDIKAVVSGLPLLSMDHDIQRRTVGAAFEHLRPGGSFIQFTYGPFPPVRKAIRDELSLVWTRSEKIWRNVPPATSYSFYRATAVR